MTLNSGRYEEVAREILEHLWVSPVGVVYMDTENNKLLIKALERAALEAQKELLLKMQQCRKRMWIPTEVPQPEFQEIAEGAVPMWFVDRELEALRIRLAELDKEVEK